ncbi:MAG: mechanosensitive ion channel family protein [Candidatus Aenigmatarchaeota archaeon]
MVIKTSNNLNSKYLRDLKILLIAISLFFIIEVLLYLILSPQLYSEYSKYSSIIFFIIIWLIATNILATLLYRKIKKENEKTALQVRSLINYISIFFLIIFILYKIGVDPSLLIASGAFGGLIIGLAAQPVLQNFFAGLIILGGRIIEPGDEVRILTSQIPYQPLAFPPYKVFSKDFLYVGYRGTVIEVGIFFSKILLETGELLTVQNYTILSAGVVNYSKSSSDENIYKKLKIRFEFDQRVKPSEVFRLLERVLKNKGDFEYYIEEVSDKGYYIVCIEGRIDETKYKYIKSEILRKLIEFNSKKIDELKEREKMMEVKVKEKLSLELKPSDSKNSNQEKQEKTNEEQKDQLGIQEEK